MGGVFIAKILIMIMTFHNNNARVNLTREVIYINLPVREMTIAR